MPVISGDPEAIQRIAYEFCEDCSHQGLLYVEARYSPHLLRESGETEKNALNSEEVVRLVNEGFTRGEKDFGVKVRSILCCMRHMTGWSTEVLELCQKFKNDGVVGIDIAGSEQLCDEATHVDHVRVFQEAAKLGICRTVHAGENGPAGVVREAIEEMHAQRIGHGYHSIDDPDVYKLVKERNIHLEVCPYSSYATGSFCGNFKEHPVRSFLLDNVNFSINTDDPLITGHTLNDEYELCKNELGMTDGDLAFINLNAAKSSFLPPDEKRELVDQLEKVYGLKD
ncbi:adenosine deaminase-like isoform X2 [Lineus longissimus]